MPRMKFLRIATAVLVAIAMGLVLCGCGGGRKQPIARPTPIASTTPTSTPSPTEEKPFGQEVPLYPETGAKKYTKPGERNTLVCDDKSTVARPLSVRGITSIDGALVETRNYSVKSTGLSPDIPMMDIIYPRTVPIKAVIVNQTTMGVVRIPKDGNYISKVRLILDVPTFVKYGGITELTACVAKPKPKKKGK